MAILSNSDFSLSERPRFLGLFSCSVRERQACLFTIKSSAISNKKAKLVLYSGNLKNLTTMKDLYGIDEELKKWRRTEKFASLRPLKSMFANNLQTISFISFFWLTSHTGNRHTDRDEELMKKGRALCFDLTACIITSLSVCLSLCLCICLSLSISLSHSKSLLHLEQGKGLVGCWWAAGWDVCLLKKQITAEAPWSKKRNFY